MPIKEVKVQVIRVKERLVAERGDALVLYPGETVEVVPAAQAHALGLFDEVKSPPLVPLPRKGVRRGTVKVFDGDAAEGVPRLYHGILRALDANFNDPMTAEDLKPFAGLSGSARLTEMHQKALLVRVNKTVPYQYIASDKGLAIARYVNGTADGPAQRWENNSSALPN